MTRESESGLPIEPVYGPEALEGWDAGERLGEPGEYPFTRGVYPTMYTGPAVDHAAVRRVRHRGGVQRALPPAARARHDGPVRSRSTCRRRWATTPTTPIARGEVGKVGVAIDSHRRTCGCCSTASRWTRCRRR